MPPETTSQPGGTNTERTAPGPTQSKDRHGANFEPSEDEKTVVGVWLKRVQRAEDEPKFKEWRESLDTLRKYERGQQTVDDKRSRTNMVYATIAAMIPELYAKNPTIAVTPTDAVGEAEMGKVKRFAETAEKGIRKMLVQEGKLKKRAKANIRAASVTSFGMLKMVYQKEYRGDPVTVRRISDTQDNLARIEALMLELKKTDDPTELAKKRDELKANLQAVTSGNEVRIFKGFVVDRIKSEDFVVLDDNVDEFDEYVDARALGHKIWMTVAAAKTLFQMEPHGATRYGRPRTDKDASKSDDTPAEEQFICVVEVWDKENGVVRTTAKGMNRWLREPYTPQHAPQRWYPFYGLGFNLTEGEWRPMSDVEMLKSLQDEYDRTRENYASVREKSAPVLVFRKAGNLTEEDVKAITNRKNKDTIGVEGNPAVPLDQDMKWFEGAKIDPQAYDVTVIRNDMDIVSGRSDASRANLIKPKTATEAEIMQEAMQSRVGERRDTHEDLLSEMGESCLEVMLRDMSKEEMVQLAGPDAEWPEDPQSVETVFRQVMVKVRAGSSGRPNQQRERESWGSLLPQIEKTMTSVAELRAAGNYDMAEAQLQLLRETLRRFDENLDIDSIIPPTEKDEKGNPVAHQQAAQALVQAKEQMTQLQEDLQKCQEALAKSQSGEQVKMREAELRAEEEGREATRKAEEQARDTEMKVAAEQSEAARQNAFKIAEEARKAEEARLTDDRAKRELDAKVKSEERVALVKAAASIVQTEITAAASARSKDAGAQKEAETRDLSEARFTELMGRVEQATAGLAKAMESLGKDSAERTALVKEHLAA